MIKIIQQFYLQKLMKKLFYILVLSIITNCVIAQSNGVIKGKLIDSIAKQSLKSASITLLNPKDSTVEHYTLAKDDGSFEISGIKLSDYILEISFQGYYPYIKKINFTTTNSQLNLGTIYLKQTDNDLPTVVVKDAPIKMKKDTLEYNASSFKTKPNAVAEDLLKKLPGVEVDKSGTVKAQGETVQRILVNGKRFFGDDPRLATRNLPPDVIDKIQVFDDQSDQSKFTGFDDGNRVKTINITTRKDKSLGYFGKAAVGAGTAGTYDGSFNINKFKGNQQITFLGQGNDVNKQNFASQNIGGGRGGNPGGGTGGASSSGITTTWAGGLNYRDQWSKSTEAYGSYFYNDQKTNTDQLSFTQNLIQNTDSSTYNDKNSAAVSHVKNHRINFNIESKLDTSNSLVFRPNLTIQNSTPYSSSTTITTGGPKNTPLNTSVNNTSSFNSGYNISGANFQLRHKFSKRFRTISFDLNFSNSLNKGDGYNYSVNSFYKPFIKVDTINQYYRDTARSYTINPTISYTEPLGKNQILEIRYSFSYNENKSVNNTFRLDNATHGYTKFDSLYSNSYNFTSNTNTATVSYRLQKTKYNFNVGTGVQFTGLESDNVTKNVAVVRNYINLTPTANFVYNFSRSKSLRLFYNGRTGQPSVSQLQPIVTTSDSINFQIGNPDLKPQFTHSFRALYSSFDPLTQRIIFATINASATTNDIQTAVIQKSNGGKTTTYTNLNGTYNINGYFNYGFPLKRPKSNLNFTTNLGYTQSQTLLADSAHAAVNDFTHNYTNNTTIGETIKWTTNLKENFDMNFSGGVTYNIANYSAQPTANADYFSYTFTTDFTYYTKNGWIIAADLDYTHYGNRSAGYNANVPLVSPSFAKQFLKNKAAEFRLTCFDIFNQNQSVTRTISGNTIVDSKTNVLTRYIMLTFTYNLRNFSQQNGRMPSMFRMGGAMPGERGGFGGGMPNNFGGGRRN
jgi:hypothetical protein